MITTSNNSVDVNALISTSRQTQLRWAGTPLRQRLKYVRAFRHLLVAECDRICRTIAEDVGKDLREVVASEVLPTADACRFVERRASAILRPRSVSWLNLPYWLYGQNDVMHRRPRGVVGVIGTWNYPLYLNAVQIVHALTCGNAVVWKPSEVTPRFAELLCELIHRSGYDQTLFVTLPATREMGPALAEADIDHFVFTGSANVGRKLAARLGERLISSTLELSGCDAQIVLDDADLTLAAKAAWFAVNVNRGQTCIAVRRAFVPRALYPAFCDLLRPFADRATPCPLAMSSQVWQAQRLVDEAIAAGGKLLVDGPVRLDGDLCRPAVIIDAKAEMSICQEASFAPVMAVIPYDKIEDALAEEAKCPYALAASVFTRSTDRARAIAARMRAGSVSVNDVIAPTAHPATSFGGRGASGWGVTQGAEGLLEMTIPQAVSLKSGTFRPHYDMTNPEKMDASDAMMRGMLQATHAPGFGTRLAGWWKTIVAARKVI